MEQERKKRLKQRGSYRLYRNYYIRNIYYIDLIDFSSKTNKWIQENIERNLKNFKKNKYDYVLVCIDGYSRYTMIRKLKNKTAKTVCYAKDKEPAQCESANNSTMNRISSVIPNPMVRYNKNIW